MDRGHSPEDLHLVTPSMEQLLSEHMGPKTQLRRWLTDYDSGGLLSKQWYTILLAVLFWWLSRGIDPYALAATILPAIKTDDSSDQKTFKFKQQVFTSTCK